MDFLSPCGNVLFIGLPVKTLARADVIFRFTVFRIDPDDSDIAEPD